jgi:hypothetical protein
VGFINAVVIATIRNHGRGTRVDESRHAGPPRGVKQRAGPRDIHAQICRGVTLMTNVSTHMEDGGDVVRDCRERVGLREVTAHERQTRMRGALDCRTRGIPHECAHARTAGEERVHERTPHESCRSRHEDEAILSVVRHLRLGTTAECDRSAIPRKT